MVGDEVKAAREAKSWSQAHLAEAARLNIRTIQRIEAGEPCSHETMLSLAAALNVDVAQLAEPERVRRAPRAPLPSWVAAILVAPAALFVGVNLLRSPVGWAAPYDLLARSGGRLMSFATFNMISPALFLGGIAAALGLSIASLVRVRSRVERGVISISGVEVAMKAAPALVALVALASGAALLGYAALEQLGSARP
jgi:transcriptional regulator with XRE-family HTH domain